MGFYLNTLICRILNNLVQYFFENFNTPIKIEFLHK